MIYDDHFLEDQLAEIRRKVERKYFLHDTYTRETNFLYAVEAYYKLPIWHFPRNEWLKRNHYYWNLEHYYQRIIEEIVEWQMKHYKRRNI